MLVANVLVEAMGVFAQHVRFDVYQAQAFFHGPGFTGLDQFVTNSLAAVGLINDQPADFDMRVGDYNPADVTVYPADDLSLGCLRHKQGMG